MSAHDETTTADQAIEAAYDDWSAAIDAVDTERFAAMLDEHWIGTTQDGRTVNVGGAPELTAQTPTGSHVVDLVVTSHGAYRLVRGGMGVTEAEVVLRFVALWRETPEGLKCLTHHETRVVESAFAAKPPTSLEVGAAMASHADPTTVGAFVSIYGDLARAMPAQDLTHLDEVIDETWFTTDPGGQLRDKAEYMDFARMYYAPTLTFDVSELSVRTWTHFAVVTCRYTLGGSFGDGVAPNQAVRVTGIWMERGDGWVYLAQQGSFIP